MTGQTILIVDDDLHIRRLLHATLSRASYQVVEARTGREALDLANRQVGRGGADIHLIANELGIGYRLLADT